jgi:predicted flap endonuclease-1-like 5' DNA nuclease
VIIFSIIVVIALAAVGGYALGRKSAYRAAAAPSPLGDAPTLAPPAGSTASAAAACESAPPPQPSANVDTEIERVGAEKARIIRSRDSETAMLRAELAARDPLAHAPVQDGDERERLSRELAASRAESARYRQLVIDIENRAPPPILAGVGEPDDLKLVVGIGPVLERMLHGLGITQFRQIAHWSERDAADFDAKLPEFPGRIQRDQWITQARELHRSKYGERP